MEILVWDKHEVFQGNEWSTFFECLAAIVSASKINRPVAAYKKLQEEIAQQKLDLAQKDAELAQKDEELFYLESVWQLYRCKCNGNNDLPKINCILLLLYQMLKYPFFEN